MRSSRRRSDLVLEVHNRIADVFLTVADEEMYEQVLQIVLDVFKSRHGIFGYIDEAGNLVCPSMTRDIFDQCRVTEKSIVFPREAWAGIWGDCLTGRRSIRSNVPGRVPEGHIAIERSVFVPILDREDLVGMIAVANRAIDYTEADQQLLESIARGIGPILHARLTRDRKERERVETELALRESENRYRAVVEQQTELVERFAPDGTITFVNDAVCRFFGVDRRFLIGTRFHPLMSDEDREAASRHLASLGPDHPVGVKEVPCVAPDGSTRWLSWTNQALFDDDGNLVEFQSVGRDITEQRRAADELRRAVAEKDALLREIHHRVKNNMAVISSLLSLQSEDFTDPTLLDQLAKVRRRIRAMALVHDQLYHSDNYQRINLGEYAQRLTDSLRPNHSRSVAAVDLETRVGDVEVSIDTAIPCGLILNELINNSLEHAFPDIGRGVIVVSLDRLEDGRCELGVRDNGVGSRFDTTAAPGSGFGMQLVELLARQLGGEVEIDGTSGTHVRVRFPSEPA